MVYFFCFASFIFFFLPSNVFLLNVFLCVIFPMTTELCLCISCHIHFEQCFLATPFSSMFINVCKLYHFPHKYCMNVPDKWRNSLTKFNLYIFCLLCVLWILWIVDKRSLHYGRECRTLCLNSNLNIMIDILLPKVYQ